MTTQTAPVSRSSPLSTLLILPNGVRVVVFCSLLSASPECGDSRN